MTINEAGQLWEDWTLEEAVRGFEMRGEDCGAVQLWRFAQPRPLDDRVWLYRNPLGLDPKATDPTQHPQHNYWLTGSPIYEWMRSSVAVIDQHWVELRREAGGDVVMRLYTLESWQPDSTELRVATRPGSGLGASAATVGVVVGDAVVETGAGMEVMAAVGAETEVGPAMVEAVEVKVEMVAEVGAGVGAVAEVGPKVGRLAEAVAEAVAQWGARGAESWTVAAARLKALAEEVEGAVAESAAVVEAELGPLPEVEAGALAAVQLKVLGAEVWAAGLGVLAGRRRGKWGRGRSWSWSWS